MVVFDLLMASFTLSTPSPQLQALKSVLEKSTIFLAGVSLQHRAEVLNRYHFETGTLPVRYLGIPLLTKTMTASDYLPLLEKIRARISSWTGRFLSFAGRIQLINSVLSSLVNFWLTVFRLPKTCVKEINKLLSAFLWSGPMLNPHKAKLAWGEVCKPKIEGGLSIRSLSETNTVSILKLIWRIVSSQNSLWVNWIQVNLIRKGSLWSVN